jgi:hypothetical protein
VALIEDRACRKSKSPPSSSNSKESTSWATKASHWDDPPLLDQQLTGDERARWRDAAHAYSQDNSWAHACWTPATAPLTRHLPRDGRTRPARPHHPQPGSGLTTSATAQAVERVDSGLPQHDERAELPPRKSQSLSSAPKGRSRSTCQSRQRPLDRLLLVSPSPTTAATPAVWSPGTAGARRFLRSKMDQQQPDRDTGVWGLLTTPVLIRGFHPRQA